MKVGVWLGSGAPTRSVRWLDGALAAAAKLGDATAIAAGSANWLDLAADRAQRTGVAAVGVPTDLRLDYLGWAQIVAAAARQLGIDTLLVDEASRPERAPEVAAIAELLDAAQLTHVRALTADGPVIRARRVVGRELQTIHVRGAAVIGIAIAGEAIDEYPTPLPSKSLKRLELSAIGIDPIVLGHRALPAKSIPLARKTVERIGEFLALHVVPRSP